MLSTNARSLLSKKAEISAAVNDSNADIIALTETWFVTKFETKSCVAAEKIQDI